MQSEEIIEVSVNPHPYRFSIYQETANRIGDFQAKHPDVDVNPIINRAIFSELEKEESKNGTTR